MIPGPSSTETVIALGYWRAGWPALILAGVLFILPAMLMILALSWAYVRYGSLPAAQWILYGINPIVISIIADALWGLGRTALKNVWLALMAVVALVLYFWGVSVVAIILGAAALTAAFAYSKSRGDKRAMGVIPVMGLGAGAVVAAAKAIPFSMTRLFLTFLKIGAVSYGSGYVLLAFMRADFVAYLSLADGQAVAGCDCGGADHARTGFRVGNIRGISDRRIERRDARDAGNFSAVICFYRDSLSVHSEVEGFAGARIFLDGINAVTVGLMAAVSWQLARGAILDAFTAAEAVIGFFILRRYQINSAWLILGGLVAGFALKFATN